MVAGAAAVVSAVPADGQTLRIAAASDLRSVMPAVVARFEKATGETAAVTYGSSGNFFSQIQNGAPFDLFFSADIDYPKKLEAGGLIERGSVSTYAVGQLVLWARADSGVDVTRGLQVLLEPRVRHVAIANPALAPYGRAAETALRRAGIYDRVQAKFVLGDNIAQTAQFVDSGNAEAGLIAHSLALDPGLKDRGTYIEIPHESYPPIEQAAGLVAASTHKPAAHAFLDFMKTSAIIQLMQSYGFERPSDAASRGR
jgi:molybdate transport system substrate-binding protein